MKYIISIAFCLVASICSSQTVDQERITRDLEVAAEVLTTLLEQQREDRRNGFWHSSIDVHHTEGVGAVFTIPRNRFGGQFPAIVIQDDDNTQERIVIEEKLAAAQVATGLRGEEDDEDLSAHIIEAAKVFLTDYGSLLRNLDASERVIIKTATSNLHNRFVFHIGGRGQQEARFHHGGRVEISTHVADILAHESGNIDDQSFADRIEIKEIEESEDVREPELDVFGSIIYRLFREDFSKTYYMDSHPYYDRLSDFGVTYQVKVYSSSSEDGRHYIPTLGKRDLTQEQRDHLVNGLYDQFVQDFKQNVLDYGHTLRSIDDDEAVIFVINLTECKNCEMPKEIELSVKKSILDGYRKGSIPLDRALEGFGLKKLR
ncbi:MAG: hypothetical protein KTR24_10240 [Saprospiraceae bacterium]|nr:hypothetical protein [Saprospiraceae bacterium]